MTKIVYKYELDPYNDQIVIPTGHRFLHLGAQNDKIFIWVEVNTNWSCALSHRYRVIPTGQSFEDDGLPFVGTVLLYDGGLVFHVYGDFQSR